MSFNNFKNLLRKKVAAFLWDYTNSSNLQDFNFNKIRKIVLWKPDGKLGDTQIISGFINELKTHFPHICIYVICNKNISSIYKDIFKVTTIEVKKRPSLFQIKKVSKEIIKNGPCDLLLSLEATVRPRDIFIANQLKPKYYTAMCSDAKCINMDLYKMFGPIHISEYFVNLFKLGHHNPPNFSYIPIAEKDSEFSKKYIGNKNVVGIAPWGASKRKHLSNDVVLKIVRALQEKTDFLVVILIPQEGYLLNKELTDNDILQDRLILLPEKISIVELSEIISNLRGLITVDTANLHIANSFNIPLIGIYNGQDDVLLKQWAPNPHNKECSVFYKKDKFINELSFDELQEPIEKFLNSIK